MRFQFPLYKIFLIFVVYAMAFGACSALGAVGIAIAVWIGTAGSALVLAVRTTKDLLSAIIAGAGSLIFVCFFEVLFVPPNLGLVCTSGSAYFVREWVIVSIGAIVGGVFFSWASKR